VGSTPHDRQARIYVVRHADAGVRGTGPDDHLRPLVAGGRERALVLADLLAPAVEGLIVSSPFTRCVETVEPLAAMRGCPVEMCPALAEPADVVAMLRLLRSLPDGSVTCTHGDMLAALHHSIVDARPVRDRPVRCDKGVVWVVSRSGSELSLVGEIADSDTRDPGVGGAAVVTDSSVAAAAPGNRAQEA
jgi:8-oxo-dGTP diphosphatase